LSSPLNFGVITVYAYEVPKSSLETIIEQVSHETGVASTSLANLAWSESRNDPLADNGSDRGIAQISRRWHPEIPDSCAFDMFCALSWAAQRIKAGFASEWTSANCYAYVSLFVKLPLMQNIIPTEGAFGDTLVAIFYYKKVKHIALVTETTKDGFWVKEANYTPFIIGKRFIPWGDKALAGFWSP